MRNIVAISLPGNLAKKLLSEARAAHASRSEVVRKALQQYFFACDFSQLRRRAQRDLARKGIRVTEEELFEKVS